MPINLPRARGTQKRFARPPLFCALLVFCFAVRAHADTVVLQTNFEADTPGVVSSGGTVGDGAFTVSGGSARIAGATFDADNCLIPGLSPQCLAVQPGQQPTSLTSNDVFGPGDYELQFDMGRFAETVVAFGTFSERFRVSGSAAAATVLRSISLDSAAELTFSFSGLEIVSSLDNIKLTRIDNQPAPVPEPASLLLLGSGLAGVGAALKKRRAQR